MRHRVHIRKRIPENVIGVAYSAFTKCRLEALAAVSSKWYLLKARNWFVNVADVEIVAASVAAYKTPVHALRAQVPIVLLSAVLKHYFALA